MSTVVEWNGRFYAGGTTGSGAPGSQHGRPAIWFSSDGREWELFEGGAFTAVTGTISELATNGSLIVAVGSTGVDVARPAVWVSGDGFAWDVFFSRAPDDSAGGTIETGDLTESASMFMSGVTATADGFVSYNRMLWMSGSG